MGQNGQMQADDSGEQTTCELENFFNISLELLCIASSDGYFLKMSREWENVLGYSIEELMSRPLTDFIHPDDINPTQHVLTHLNDQQPVHFFINRYRTKKGDFRYLEWNSMPAGNRIYAAARDITDRINLQQSLEQSVQKEKQLNDLKSRFVSMASHEFRTPLTSILMSTETLRSYWPRMNAQQIDSKLANIHSQISHLTTIVTNVLQLARIQEGKLLPDLKLVQLTELCRSVIKTFVPDDSTRQTIRFSSTAEQPEIFADEVMIRQVLINLLSNALKYSQPNPQVEVTLTSNGKMVEIKVADNGIGIPEKDQKNVFQPFFRAANAKGIEGNGLGLNIVKETIQLHGGRVRFDSSLLKGTTFYIELPVVQPMINREQ
jgi:PAS domain S-box-containing protein